MPIIAALLEALNGHFERERSTQAAIRRRNVAELSAGAERVRRESPVQP